VVIAISDVNVLEKSLKILEKNQLHILKGAYINSEIYLGDYQWIRR
jgi:hypothetical protein